MSSDVLTVTLYTRPGCHLCEQAKADLEALQDTLPHRLVEVDIEQDEALLKAYGFEIPVVKAGPFELKAPFDRRKLQMTLGAAHDRKKQLDEIGDAEYKAAVARGKTMTGADRFSLWFARYYLWLFNLFVLLYLGLPFLAPVLMKSGAELPATIIYRVYGALCHQLSYRSFFLFGEQPIYPRAAAEVEGYQSFREATGLDEEGLVAARTFIGDERIGYKVALCERDVAIYGGILLFGVLFGLTGRKWKGFPVLAWVLVGLVPIGLDGVSQLISQIFVGAGIDLFEPLAKLLPYRESTPFLRVLTGFLFGFTTAWFGYPLVEETMQDTRRLLMTKSAQVKRLSRPSADL